MSPIKSDSFRKMYIRQTKNDSKDSFVIAKIMRFGQFHQHQCRAKTLWRYAAFMIQTVSC